MPLSAADFRALREKYGFTVVWLSDAFRVRERTIHRWEAGDVVIPGPVGQQVETVWAEDFAKTVAKYTEEIHLYGSPVLVPRRDENTLDEYPAAFHRAAALEAAQQSAHRTPVHLDYLPRTNPDLVYEEPEATDDETQ